MDFDVTRELVKAVSVEQFLDQLGIVFKGEGGTKIFEATYSKAVGEAILHAILWGRSSFRLSSDPKAMDAAVTAFIAWTADIRRTVSDAISDSALGTGYEEQLRREVFLKLGINESAGKTALPSNIALT